MRRFLALLLMSLVLTLGADTVSASVLDMNYNLFSPKGVSSGTTYTTIRDRDGFIWTSTRNGIDRYDGMGFRHYRLNGNISRGMHDGMMIYLYQDEQGRLWVYTERSIIYRYNPGTDTFEEALTFPIEDQVGSVQCMYVYGDEVVLGLTNGLMSYDMANGKKRVVHLLNERSVRCIAPYRDGMLLIGTNKGLALYDPERHRAATAYDRFFTDIRAIYYSAADQTIWVGTNGQGFYLVDEAANGRATRVGPERLLTYCICPASENECLVGTDGDGMLLLTRTPSGADVMQLACDTEDALYPIHCSCVRHVMMENGNIWVSMHFGGIVRMQPSSGFAEIRNPESKTPADSYAFGASFDAQNRVWVAFNQAIGCYDLKGVCQGLYLDHQARFLTVEPAPDGTVWCGGFNTGLYHFDPVTGEKEFFSSVHGSASNDCVYALQADRQGNMWVGGMGFGMTCIKTEKNRRIGDDPLTTIRFDHTGIDQVYDIEFLSDTLMALATCDGLYLYNNYTRRSEHLFQVDDASEWKGTNFFASLASTNGEDVWLATDGAGLLCYNIRSRKFESYGFEHGLPSLELRGVVTLNDSTLCVSSEQSGLFTFDCKRRTFLHNLFNLGGVDGSQFQQNAIATDGQGMVVAGGDKGAFLLSADDLKTEHTSTSIHIDGHAIVNETITLPYHNPVLSVSLTTTDIRHQQEYHFLYRISSIDKEWVHLDDARHLEHHYLASGNYTLDIRAVGAGGQLFERTLRIVVERNPMQFVGYGLVSLLVLIILFFIHKGRRKN